MNRKFVKEFGVTHWDKVGRSGICQQTFPEKGFALPGTLIVGMDSHTTSYGAFNAAATAIRAAEAYYVAAKGEIWFKVPEPIRFEITGELPSKVMGKDVILKIAGDYGTDMAIYNGLTRSKDYLTGFIYMKTITAHQKLFERKTAHP